MFGISSILTILAIPGVILIVIGYGLIVKDHFDKKKRRKAKFDKRSSSEEE
jgi:hypothetical protein